MNPDPQLIRQWSADIAAFTTAATEPAIVSDNLPEPALISTDGTNCKQHIRISIFFDGTGNNLDADFPDGGQSNVAKLFRAHPLEDYGLGIFAIYVPGIGTYFKEIGDEGGGRVDRGLPGLGFGYLGQERLNWATTRFREQIEICDKRADLYPDASIVDIKVAVFGFSRGAAAARAFCTNLTKTCPDEKYKLPVTERNVPIEVDFLGIFDTVASVGLPTSANTLIDWTKLENAALPPGAGSFSVAVEEDPLAKLAIGEPGAAPAFGSSDGHYAWGKNIEIGKIVKRGLHLVAAHEWRNSFPLDSILAGSAYPPSMAEMVVPGAHSDVGGGYEPGEGGKSRLPGSLMSLIPLWIMFEDAGRTVPFNRFIEFRKYNREDFGIDSVSHDSFKAMSSAYRNYLTKIKPGESLGKTILQHSHLYYAWRFRAIRRSPVYAKREFEQRDEAAAQSARRLRELENAKALHTEKGWPWTAGAENMLQDTRKQSYWDQFDLEAARRNLAQAGEDDMDVGRGEATFGPARDLLAKAAARTRQEARAASVAVARIEQTKKYYFSQGVTWDANQESELRQAREIEDTRKDEYLRARARLDTKANDKKLLASIRKFDRQLMEDAEKLDVWAIKDPALKLRPHYKIILEAYRNEFRRNCGLGDTAVIDFFDHFVHDSLSGFGSDDTRPSDPRIIYVGKDTRLNYAANDRISDPAGKSIA